MLYSSYTEITDAVIDMAQEVVSDKIVVGALPPENGISMAPAAGASDITFFNKGQAMHISMVVNSKNEDQKTALDNLGKIHERLTLTEDYPSGDTWQITNIETNSTPVYLDREQNSQYLYGSSVRIDFYMKGI